MKASEQTFPEELFVFLLGFVSLNNTGDSSIVLSILNLGNEVIKCLNCCCSK